jgi:CRISPR/Cas system-associated exonuclease Cas4 (RecB family)
MGVLETRALDFKNIILVSVNEGVMPKTDAAASFIPYNLRRGFGLPTIEHQDSVYAYYFYRLMHRAENIALIYNTQTGSTTSEMSRFIYQLRYESAFKVKELGLRFTIALSEEKDITITKTPSITESLQRFYAANGKECITPTGINTWLDCSLRFYFRYVARIYPREEVSENLEGAMFGKLLHRTIELVYRRYAGKPLNESDLELLLKDNHFLEECVLKAFAIEFFKKPDQEPKLYGKSLIVKEVLLNYIRQIVQVDKKFTPLSILEFEKTILTTQPVLINGKTTLVNIGGNIDRLDRTSGVLRVIDYKTGTSDHYFQSIEQLFDRTGSHQNKDVVQILLYAIALSDDKKYSNYPVGLGIYSLRDIYKKDFDPRIVRSKTEIIENIDQVKNSYLTGLQGVLSEIFNPDIPFTKVSDKKKCEFCDYTMICHR